VVLPGAAPAGSRTAPLVPRRSSRWSAAGNRMP